MFDFPGTPTNGQMFTPVAGGPSYVFQSPVWRLAAGGVNPGFWVGDAPPSSPVQGTLWWESDSGNSFIWYDDGSSAQWVQFNIAPPTVPLPSPFMRTRITASTTTFQFDPSTLFADVEVCGGGGGGASCPTGGAAGQAQAGSGGSGGGYAKKLIQVTAAIRAATKTITVGAAGTSGVAGNPSSYDDTINTLTGNAGNVGNQSGITTLFNTTSGNAGGTASGGDINIPGQPGGWSLMAGTAGPTCRSGAGGNSALGMGGNAVGGVTGGGAYTGSAATGFGAGGSGAAANSTGGGVGGGAGSPGVVIITEYR